MSKSKVVVLQGYPVLNEHGVAAAAIIPGMLVQGVTTISPAGAGKVARTFALEREYMGDDINTPYKIGDVVKIGSFAPGDVVNALVVSGAVAAGAFVESNGDGYVKAGATNPIGRAVENQISGSNRLAVEIY